MIISIPSVVILTCFIMSLYGGEHPLHHADALRHRLLAMFAIGGLTGLPLA